MQCHLHPDLTFACNASLPRPPLQVPVQGLTALQTPQGMSPPPLPATKRQGAGGRPLHSMMFPVHDVLHYTITVGRTPSVQDPEGGCRLFCGGPVKPWPLAWFQSILMTLSYVAILAIVIECVQVEV